MATSYYKHYFRDKRSGKNNNEPVTLNPFIFFFLRTRPNEPTQKTRSNNIIYKNVYQYSNLNAVTIGIRGHRW